MATGVVPADLAGIDELIVETWTEMRVERSRFLLSPSGECATRAEELEARLNELLEARFALRGRR